MKKTILILMIGSSIIMSGCSWINEISIDVVSMVIVPPAIEAAMAEPDMDLGLDSIPGMSMLLSGMLKLSPENYNLNNASAMMMMFYGMAYVEEEYWELKEDEANEEKNAPRMEYLKKRSKGLYARGRKHAFFMLPETFESAALNGSEEEFKTSLQEDIDDAEYVEGLTYLAMNWLLYINLSKDLPGEVIFFGRVRDIVARAVELDKERDKPFFYGMPHMLLGALYAALGKPMGGDPEKGREYFEQAIQLSDGKFLLSKMMYAQFYATQKLDEELFDKLLGEVLSAPDDILPDQMMANAVAKKISKRLIRTKENLF